VLVQLRIARVLGNPNDRVCSSRSSSRSGRAVQQR